MDTNMTLCVDTKSFTKFPNKAGAFLVKFDQSERIELIHVEYIPTYVGSGGIEFGDYFGIAEYNHRNVMQLQATFLEVQFK